MAELITMGTIAQELPYLWAPTESEINRLNWIILAIFNDHRFAHFDAYREAQAAWEERKQDTGFRAEAQICVDYALIIDTHYDATRAIRLPSHTYLRFRSESDAAHFKLRWL
jgi:hypothetical protein